MLNKNVKYLILFFILNRIYSKLKRPLIAFFLILITFICLSSIEKNYWPNFAIYKHTINIPTTKADLVKLCANYSDIKIDSTHSEAVYIGCSRKHIWSFTKTYRIDRNLVHFMTPDAPK